MNSAYVVAFGLWKDLVPDEVEVVNIEGGRRC